MRVEPVLDREHDVAAAFAVDRRHREQRTFPAIGLREGLDARGALFRRNEVHLVQHQPARLVVQRLVITFQLADDRAGIANRIGLRIERRDVDDVQQEPRALQMAQELVPQSSTFGGALDQPRDVGNHETAV